MTGAYDGIIIGAGHHGLILGTYLARAGLKVLLVERRLMYGGGLSTEERTLPGFYHGPHGTNHFAVSESPWFRDLQLAGRVQYITPHHEFAQPHLDGSALIFSRDLESTVASIAQFSKADANTFRQWSVRAEEMVKRIFMKERYAEPLPEAERDEILARSAVGRDFLELTKLQPIDAICDLFEDDRVRALFAFKLSLFGTVLKNALESKNPTGSLIRAFDLSTGYEVVKGGSFNLAIALMEAYVRAGGQYLNQAQIEEIETEGGRASGIRLVDGRSYRARRFIASTIDPHQTFNELLDPSVLPEPFREKVAGFKHSGTLFALHLALNEAPDYLASRSAPGMNSTLKQNVGGETLTDLLAWHGQVARGEVPDGPIQFSGGSLTPLDPTQAPPGQHTAYALVAVPFAPGGDPSAIAEVRNELRDRVLERWRQYAPNMTPKNVLGSWTLTPHEYSQDYQNMRFGDFIVGALTSDQVMYNHFGYRTPIEGLYMAGSPVHPNGAITGGGGYIVAGMIAGDLGITPWWKPLDVRSALLAIPSS